MSAKEIDELFELIKALTPMEKRYFKLYFERNFHSESTIYIRIVDAISAMDTFDKSKLEKKFKGNNAVLYFSKTKALLLDAIYESQLQYNKSLTFYNEVQNGLNKIQLLLRKGVYHTAERYVEKYKALAYASGQFALLHEILSVEDDLLTALLKDTSSVLQEIDVVISILGDEQFFNSMNREVYKYYTQYGVRLPAEQKLKVQQIQNELLQRTYNPKSYTSIVKRNTTVALTHYLLLNNKAAVDTLQAYLSVYFTLPIEFQSDRTKEIIRQMNNMLSFAFNTRDYEYYSSIGEIVNQYLNSIENEETAKLEVQLSMLFSKISLTHDYTIFTNEIQTIESNIKPLEQIHLVRRGDYTFNIALLYSKVNKMNDSLRWLQYFFEIPNIERRNYIFEYARLLEILLHWKLNSHDLVESKTLSLKRYLTKKGKLGEFEKILLSFINSSVTNYTPKVFTRAMQQFRSNLAELDKTTYAGIIENYTELLEWFDQSP